MINIIHAMLHSKKDGDYSRICRVSGYKELELARCKLVFILGFMIVINYMNIQLFVNWFPQSQMIVIVLFLIVTKAKIIGNFHIFIVCNKSYLIKK